MTETDQSFLKAPSEYTEFICYSIYRLWNHKPLDGSQFIPPKELNTFFITRSQQLLHHVSSWPLLYLALLYIAKLRVSLPKTLTSSGSEYKILVAALILSFKFNSDKNIPNKYWAYWSGLTLQDTAQMEIEFLSCLDFRLFIKSREYEIWKNSVSVLHQEYLVYKKVLDLQGCDKGTIQSLPKLDRARTWR